MGKSSIIASTECQVGGQSFTVAFDSCATINAVTEDVVSQLGCKRIKEFKPVQGLGEFDLSEVVMLHIDLGVIHADIKAHVVPKIPVDILLGQEFLLQNSKGYKLMLEEFGILPEAERSEPQTQEEVTPTDAICAMASPEKWDMLIQEFRRRGLILEGEEMPDPNRHYTKRTFSLGLPDDKRNKIYFRPQYQPHPQDVEEYRKIMDPLIKAGVYQVSNSPHNNPVMLVAKKTPGQYRLVVDNRLVNKDCKPAAAMSANPLGVIRMMEGAKIFTTLDCKNAFYCLPLAEADRELTAISVPGYPHLELTRMPMGAKASMAALFLAMTETVGDALYRYVLIWADDIIIYSKNEEEHFKHVREILDRLDKKWILHYQGKD